MTPTLSVIVPTVGRPSLMRLLEQVQPDLGANDEVLVIGDGPQEKAEWIVSTFVDTRLRYLPGPETHCFGNAQRQFGMSQATGSHLCFFDDDDHVLTGGLRILHTLATKRPNTFTLTRMLDKHGRVVWHDPAVRETNVSTQMILCPNVPHRLGQWGARYEGDYDFISSTLAVGQWPIHWSTTLIADCRP